MLEREPDLDTVIREARPLPKLHNTAVYLPLLPPPLSLLPGHGAFNHCQGSYSGQGFLSSIHPTTNLSQQNSHSSSPGANGISNRLAAHLPSWLVMSGRCTATTVVFGKITIPCPCLHGEFDVPLSALHVPCKVCAHPLSQHEDASSSIAQDSLSQGMSSSFQ
jgi:hypothetical protein